MKKLFTLILGITLAYSCSSSSDDNGNSTTTGLPTLTTSTISSIAANTAASGGTISSDGGAAITARGVCWSTSANPTIALSTKTNNGAGTGSFVSNITGLTGNTTYYVRAYATNSEGTAYGTQLSFITLPNSFVTGPNVTDIDGNIYASITNCSQTWIQRNLNVSKYSDGTPIPQVTDPTQWANLTTGAWCYYNNDTANGNIYGKLYNWYAVAGIYNAASAANVALRKKLAPAGWHVNTIEDWEQLSECLGGGSAAGGKLKSTGTLQAGTGLWRDPNIDANNESGFTAIPGGEREVSNGTFYSISYVGFWWCSSEYIEIPNTAIYRNLNYDTGDFSGAISQKGMGYSVRCVKDQT